MFKIRKNLSFQVIFLMRTYRLSVTIIDTIGNQTVKMTNLLSWYENFSHLFDRNYNYDFLFDVLIKSHTSSWLTNEK